jgi:hypothetical protein
MNEWMNENGIVDAFNGTCRDMLVKVVVSYTPAQGISTVDTSKPLV